MLFSDVDVVDGMVKNKDNVVKDEAIETYNGYTINQEGNDTIIKNKKGDNVFRMKGINAKERLVYVKEAIDRAIKSGAIKDSVKDDMFEVISENSTGEYDDEKSALEVFADYVKSGKKVMLKKNGVVVKTSDFITDAPDYYQAIVGVARYANNTRPNKEYVRKQIEPFMRAQKINFNEEEFNKAFTEFSKAENPQSAYYKGKDAKDTKDTKDKEEFRSGDKVYLKKEYEDKPGEQFTLKDWSVDPQDPEDEGGGFISDKNGRGWRVNGHQITKHKP